jgi:hypothetical protein
MWKERHHGESRQPLLWTEFSTLTTFLARTSAYFIGTRFTSSTFGTSLFIAS